MDKFDFMNVIQDILDECNSVDEVLTRQCEMDECIDNLVDAELQRKYGATVVNCRPKQ